MALPPNPLQSFIWGRGGAALTPEQVAREREVAEALMAQGIDTSPVGHWTQGAARMANVLAGKLKEGRASSAESAGRTAFSDRLSSILGGSPATSTAMATAPAPDYASARVAQAHNAGGATVPTGERAEYIRQGLLNRGLPGHVADAFLMNFQDESGLNPGINEVAPLVPGSRGGYGLYQLTGPRRRAYEAFATERGVPLDDIDAQLDFLMQEGSGAERAAFERILSAPDTGTAAVEIVNRFLRPAQAHRESRSARYSRAPNTAVGANEAMAAGSLAGAPVAETPQDILAQEAAMAAQDPMAFQQPAMPMGAPQTVSDMPIADIARSLTAHQVNPDLPMAGNTSGFLPVAQSLAAQSQQQGGMPNMQQLIELASDPWATDAQRGVVQALLQQQMQAQQAQQAQQQRLMAAQQAGIDPRFAGDDEIWKAAVRQQFGDPTTDIQEYEYARQRGFLGSFTDFQIAKRQAGGVNVNMSTVGAPPTGYENVYDDQGRILRQDMIEGGPAWRENLESEETRARGLDRTERLSHPVIQDMDEGMRQLEEFGESGFATWLRAKQSGLEGTQAYDLNSLLKAAESTISLQALQELKEVSGAGLGNVSDRQSQLLSEAYGSLNIGQSKQQLMDSMARVRNIYLDIMYGRGRGPKRSKFRGEEWKPVAGSEWVDDSGKPISWDEVDQILGPPDSPGADRSRTGVRSNTPISEMTDEELEALANGNR